MTVKLGLSAKLYHNTGTYATPVWNEMTDAQDVTVTLDKGEAEVKRRGITWREHLLHLKEATIDVEFLHDPDTDDYAIVRDAYFNNSVLDVLALDGPSTGPEATGFRAECQVKTFTHNQPLEETLTDSVQFRPTPTANGPPVPFTVP